jgi:SAM-dependent methyltransferase
VLDLGCGNGRNAVALENLGLEVFGVDAAARSWPFCRHPRRFHQASVRDLPFEGGFFDAVLDVGCLHMLFDPGDLSAAAAEIVRVLRQGGVVVGRALKPQSRRWLKAQPFAIPRAGLDPRELAQAFRHLRLDILHDLPGLTYYRVYQP